VSQQAEQLAKKGVANMPARGGSVWPLSKLPGGRPPVPAALEPLAHGRQLTCVHGKLQEPFDADVFFAGYCREQIGQRRLGEQQH